MCISRRRATTIDTETYSCTQQLYMMGKRSTAAPSHMRYVKVHEKANHEKAAGPVSGACRQGMYGAGERTISFRTTPVLLLVARGQYVAAFDDEPSIGWSYR